MPSFCNLSRLSLQHHRKLAALLRLVVCRFHRVFADGSHRFGRTALGAVCGKDGARGRHGRSAGRQRRAPRLPAAASSPPGHNFGGRGNFQELWGIKAVQDTSFCVKDRSLHALIGPNGAGKTTAFNVISGMYTPDAGKVVLEERSVGGLSPGAITQAGIGRSFQITNLFPALTVLENVRLAVQSRDPKRFNFWTAAERLSQVNTETAAMIRTMGLAGIERVEAGSLSYGGQRLLDMALALATKPRVLLLDEPLAGWPPPNASASAV